MPYNGCIAIDTIYEINLMQNSLVLPIFQVLQDGTIMQKPEASENVPTSNYQERGFLKAG